MKVITDFFSPPSVEKNSSHKRPSKKRKIEGKSDAVEGDCNEAYYETRKIKIRLADPNIPDSFVCEVYDTSADDDSEVLENSQLDGNKINAFQILMSSKKIKSGNESSTTAGTPVAFSGFSESSDEELILKKRSLRVKKHPGESSSPCRRTSRRIRNSSISFQTLFKDDSSPENFKPKVSKKIEKKPSEPNEEVSIKNYFKPDSDRLSRKRRSNSPKVVRKRSSKRANPLSNSSNLKANGKAPELKKLNSDILPENQQNNSHTFNKRTRSSLTPVINNNTPEKLPIIETNVTEPLNDATNNNSIKETVDTSRRVRSSHSTDHEMLTTTRCAKDASSLHEADQSKSLKDVKCKSIDLKSDTKTSCDRTNSDKVRCSASQFQSIITPEKEKTIANDNCDSPKTRFTKSFKGGNDDRNAIRRSGSSLVERKNIKRTSKSSEELICDLDHLKSTPSINDEEALDRRTSGRLRSSCTPVKRMKDPMEANMSREFIEASDVVAEVNKQPTSRRHLTQRTPVKKSELVGGTSLNAESETRATNVAEPINDVTCNINSLNSSTVTEVPSQIPIGPLKKQSREFDDCSGLDKDSLDKSQSDDNTFHTKAIDKSSIMKYFKPKEGSNTRKRQSGGVSEEQSLASSLNVIPKKCVQKTSLQKEYPTFSNNQKRSSARNKDKQVKYAEITLTNAASINGTGHSRVNKCLKDQKSSNGRKDTMTKGKSVDNKTPVKVSEPIIFNDIYISPCKVVLESLKLPCKDISPSSKKSPDSDCKVVLVKPFAPLFLKKPKVVPLDADIAKARKQFLISGVPEAIKKIVNPEKDVDDIERQFFPTISHVQQKGDEKVWCSRTVNLTLRPELYYVPDHKLFRYKITNSESKSSAQLPLNVRQTIDKTVMEKLKNVYRNIPFENLYLNMKTTSENFSAVCSKSEDELSLPMWTQKYRPIATGIVSNDRTVERLRQWLRSWLQYGEMLKKGLKKASDSSDDFVSSEDEDSQVPATACLIHGPISSGKTSLVHALAAELDITVLEVNASSRRTGKKILADLQEATQSRKVVNDVSCKSTRDVNKDAMSMIVVEDADLVYDDQDDGFISALHTLIASAKRPVLLLTSDPNVKHLDKFKTRHTLQLEMVRPHPTAACAILEIIALLEGANQSRSHLLRFIEQNGFDLRRSILELQFWLSVNGNKVNTWMERPITASRLWWSSHRLLFESPLWHSATLKTRDSQKEFLYDSASNGSDTKPLDKLENINEYTRYFECASVADFLRGRKPDISWPSSDFFVKDSLSVCQELTDTDWKMKEVNSEIEEKLLAGCSSIFLGQRKKGFKLEPFIPYNESRWFHKQRKASEELLVVVPLRLNSRSAHLDYLPSLRSICRTEQQKAVDNSKRKNRFYHYLKTLGGSPTEDNLSINCSVFKLE